MLFDSFAIKNLVLKNRIVMPPMCMYSGDKTGFPKEWHYLHYATGAVGGAGLLIQEATGIEDSGRISARCLGLWEDGQGEALKRIVVAGGYKGSLVSLLEKGVSLVLTNIWQSTRLACDVQEKLAFV